MLGFYAQHLGDFARSLFTSDSFDDFLVPEASFLTSFTTEIDGQLYGKENTEPFVRWGVLRPLAFQLIRGKTLPRGFTLVFMLSREKTAAFLAAVSSVFSSEDVAGLYLNFRYAREQLSVTTGAAMKEFTPDRSLEQAWDKQVQKFLDQLSLS